MTKMIALKPHRYGVQRQTGDRYEVPSGAQERLVTALAWAAVAPPEIAPEPPKRAYVRRDVVAAAPVIEPAIAVESAAPTAQPEPEPDAALEAEPKPKRTYHRRDMTAET